MDFESGCLVVQTAELALDPGDELSDRGEVEDEEEDRDEMRAALVFW
jgi:hypothetical protein